MMKGLLIWFAALGVLLSLLGFLVGAEVRRGARPADPSVYTETVEPELPAIPETQPDAPDTSPAFTF